MHNLSIVYTYSFFPVAYVLSVHFQKTFHIFCASEAICFPHRWHKANDFHRFFLIMGMTSASLQRWNALHPGALHIHMFIRYLCLDGGRVHCKERAATDCLYITRRLAASTSNILLLYGQAVLTVSD